MPATLSPRNHWTEEACARAFWSQHELPPYRELLTDTVAWLEPRPGERWLDLGCGGGQLTRALWTKGEGALEEIVGLDCAAANERAFQKLRAGLLAPTDANRIRFICADFSTGLGAWESEYFDGIVSGLAIHYAESYSAERGCWTTDAYDHLLTEAHRLLRPGGWFVFSVMRPEPAWAKVAWSTLAGVLQARRPAHYLKRALRIWLYGPWVTREARRGRFHYLPRSVVEAKLRGAGFTALEHRRSFARQAYLFQCRK
jgi:SAM-dependent methyltransferase